MIVYDCPRCIVVVIVTAALWFTMKLACLTERFVHLWFVAVDAKLFTGIIALLLVPSMLQMGAFDLSMLHTTNQL